MTQTKQVKNAVRGIKAWAAIGYTGQFSQHYATGNMWTFWGTRQQAKYAQKTFIKHFKYIPVLITPIIKKPSRLSKGS